MNQAQYQKSTERLEKLIKRLDLTLWVALLVLGAQVGVVYSLIVR